MAGKKKKTTTIVEEIPPGENPLSDETETTDFDLALHRADDIETVEQILADQGISNVIYRFYDNDGGYCYSSPELDYDRARRETKGGKHCKLGVFIGNKLMRMVPFPLAPVDTANPAPPVQPSSDLSFFKEMVLKLIENRSTPAPAGPSLSELTSALKNLDDMRGKQESAMDLFQKGLEFAQGMNGSTDWKTDALRTVRDIAPQIMGVFNGVRNGGAVPPANPGEQPSMLPPDTVIKAGIAYLKKKAIAGVDPGLIIEWVVNNAEEYEALLGVILNREFAEFVQYDPEIGTEPFVSWFKPLFDGLRSEFSPANPVDEHPAGDVGNTSDPGNHGESRKGGGAKPKS